GRQQFLHFGAKLVAGLGLKLGDSQVAEAVLDYLAAHTLHLDDVADDFHLEGRVDALPENGQGDGGTPFAAHQFDGVLEGHALHRLVVELDDQVAGAQPGLVRGGAVDGGDDPDKAVLGADLDTQAANFATGALLKVAEGRVGEGGGVRVEPRQHAPDGRLGQDLVAHLLHIGIADLVENLHKQLQFVEGQGAVVGGLGVPDLVPQLGVGLQRQADHCRQHQPGEEFWQIHSMFPGSHHQG